MVSRNCGRFAKPGDEQTSNREHAAELARCPRFIVQRRSVVTCAMLASAFLVFSCAGPAIRSRLSAHA